MTIDVDSINVNYSDAGSGQVVVILQGWGTNLSLYSGLVAHLSGKMRVLVPELPGFGLTPAPPHSFNADDYADFTEKFLTALGIDECSLIGHSNGGRIIMKLTTRAGSPFKFDKLVFIDSAGVVHPKSGSQKFKQFGYKAGKKFLSFPPVKSAFPRALDDYRSHHGSADYRAASPVMRETLVKLVNEDFTSLMPRIKQPSLLIWGENDTDTPLSDGMVFDSLIPDSGLVTVKGAGHYSYLEHPHFVFSVLDSFFKIQ